MTKQTAKDRIIKRLNNMIQDTIEEKERCREVLKSYVRVNGRSGERRRLERKLNRLNRKLRGLLGQKVEIENDEIKVKFEGEGE